MRGDWGRNQTFGGGCGGVRAHEGEYDWEMGMERRWIGTKCTAPPRLPNALGGNAGILLGAKIAEGLRGDLELLRVCRHPRSYPGGAPMVPPDAALNAVDTSDDSWCVVPSTVGLFPRVAERPWNSGHGRPGRSRTDEGTHTKVAAWIIAYFAFELK